MALAQEVARKGITVNTVSPGYVNTAMVEAVPADIRQAIIAKVPVGRLADPREIAWAVGFLVAEESGYITGANLPVNGGLYLG
jgi:acetoacetyl-CoA reductase